MPYKIDLIQVRKLTVYCNAENEEEAERWLEKNKDDVFGYLNLEHPQIEFPQAVHCYTVWGVTKDNSAERLYNLLHCDDDKGEEQMEAVYKVLKQEQPDNGSSN